MTFKINLMHMVYRLNEGFFPGLLYKIVRLYSVDYGPAFIITTQLLLGKLLGTFIII